MPQCGGVDVGSLVLSYWCNGLCSGIEGGTGALEEMQWVVAVEWSLSGGWCQVGMCCYGLMGSCWRVEMAGYGALVFTAAVTTSEVTDVRVRKAKS
jgi:hypothetical protein